MLKRITDLTVNDLLNKEIILPSLYFEKFNENAKNIEINLEDKEFEKEINKLIVDEYNLIDDYMKSIISNVSILQECSKEAQTALLDKNVDALNSIYKRMNNLEKELKSMNKKIFLDEVTNTYNRKWIYSKLLSKDGLFKEDGVVFLLDITDYDYIKNEYQELIANNLLIFSINFISKNLKEENYEFKIARFFENKFLIFVENIDIESAKSTILNIRQVLANTTLKSNSGLLIKATYEFTTEAYNKNQDSKELFEKLFYKAKE